MKIRTKILVGFFIIIALASFLGITVFFNTLDVSKSFTFLVEHDLEVLQNAQKLQKLVVDAETGQRGFIITGDESFLEPYNNGINGFDALIKVEKGLVSDNPSQVQRLENIQALFEEWQLKAAQPEINAARTFFESSRIAIEPGKTIEHEEIHLVSKLLQAKTGKNILDQIRDEFTIFIQIENNLKDERLADVSTTSTFTQTLLILLPISIITVAGFIALFFIQSISKPLEILKLASSRLSSGNLDTKIEKISSSDDEIKELSDTFNIMVDEIKKSRTQIEAQYAELKKTDIKKDEFASMVSHELKTPLVPIKLHAEMLLDGEFYGKLSDKQKDAVAQIFKSADNLQRLIDDILDVRKIELEHFELSKQEINVKDFLDENITILNSFCQEKNITLKSKVQNSIKVFADPERLSQVLSNLIKNSVDFVPEQGGQITIMSEKNNSEVIFTVQDNGKGIAVEDQKEIFKKFYQVDTSDRRKHGGTGLGLAICEGIVKAHGGKIWLDTQYTSGASFKFSIPGDNNQ